MHAILLLLTLYSWAIFLRVLLSWANADPRNPIVELLHQLTEPALRPLRRLIPPERLGGVDISPFLAILLIRILKSLLWALFG
jgi:YggT family protein